DRPDHVGASGVIWLQVVYRRVVVELAVDAVSGYGVRDLAGGVSVALGKVREHPPEQGDVDGASAALQENLRQSRLQLGVDLGGLRTDVVCEEVSPLLELGSSDEP